MGCKQFDIEAHDSLSSAQPSGMFVLAALELHWIHRARRHLLLGLLRLVRIQLSKRHVTLRHHRSPNLVIQEIRTSTGVFAVRFGFAGNALLVSFQQEECQSDDRGKPEEAAHDAYTCLCPDAEGPCLVGLAACLGRARSGAYARLRWGRRGRCGGLG
jgi:hypothetical protein